MNENGYSYGNSGGMDDDSFNVFNQNAEAYQQQQEALRQQAAQAQEAAVQRRQALAQAHEAKENAMVIEDEPKKKTIFDKLKKKKEPQEERKFDLNDPSTFTKVEKEKKEISDDDKKKFEVLLLLVLVVVLGVVGFWAFTVFKNSMGLKNIDNSGSLIHEI